MIFHQHDFLSQISITWHFQDLDCIIHEATHMQLKKREKETHQGPAASQGSPEWAVTVASSEGKARSYADADPYARDGLGERR